MANADNSTENTANNDYIPFEGSCGCGEKSAEEGAVYKERLDRARERMSVNRNDKAKTFGEAYSGPKVSPLIVDPQFKSSFLNLITALTSGPEFSFKAFEKKVLDFRNQNAGLRELDPAKFDQIVNQLEMTLISLENAEKEAWLNKLYDEAPVYSKVKTFVFPIGSKPRTFEYELEITPRKLLRAAVVGLGVYYAYRLWKRRS